MTRKENSPAPSAVVFDLGKVLLDFDYGIAARHFQRRCSTPVDFIRAAIDQSGLLHDFETNRISALEFFERLRQATGFAGDFDEFSEIFRNVFTPIEPMLALHARLRGRGVPVFIFSNTNFLQAAHIRRTYPFFAEFDGYVLSCEHGVMKPDARIYEVVERMTGRRGGELLYIDDRPENVAAGAARGWHAILHSEPSRTEAAVRAAGLLG